MVEAGPTAGGLGTRRPTPQGWKVQRGRETCSLIFCPI